MANLSITLAPNPAHYCSDSQAPMNNVQLSLIDGTSLLISQTLPDQHSDQPYGMLPVQTIMPCAVMVKTMNKTQI